MSATVCSKTYKMKKQMNTYIIDLFTYQSPGNETQSSAHIYTLRPSIKVSVKAFKALFSKNARVFKLNNLFINSRIYHRQFHVSRPVRNLNKIFEFLRDIWLLNTTVMDLFTINAGHCSPNTFSVYHKEEY